MTSIKIFKSNKEIDLPTLIDSRMLICANSGGGKSYFIRKLLEETHGKVMSIVLDIEGEFKTLREQFDFLLIGENGDVPLNMKSANLLPKKLLELNVSTIVDISELKKGERVQYVKKFIEALMEVPRSLWKPLILILDECHNLAGQQEKQDSCPSVIDVATRGRKRGFCLTACTQRIAKLHKDVVAELNNYMVGRTGLDIDQKRAGEILGFTSKQDVLSLRDLEPGEFYVFGTAISKGVEKEKVGLVKTTHPKVGMDIRVMIVPPTSKIRSMLKKLNDLPQEAEENLKEKRDYLRKIHELEAKLRIKGKQEVTKVVSNIGEVRALNHKIKTLEAKLNPAERNHQIQKHRADESQKQLKQGESIIKIIYPIISKFIQVEKNIEEFLKKPPLKVNPPKKIEIHSHKEIAEVPPTQIPRPNIEYPEEEKPLNKCSKTIYGFLVANSGRGFTRPQIGAMTGYSFKSGGFQTSISHLFTKGLIIKESNLILVNPENIDPELGDTTEKYSIESIKKKINKCARELLEVLIENPSSDYSREELAMATPTEYSYNSGGFQTAISKLNTLGLIKKIDGGRIKLSEDVEELL